MKKAISISAGVVFLIAAIAFSFVFVTRKTFTYDKVHEIVKENIHSQPTYNNTYYIKMILGSDANEIFVKYFDNNKIETLYLDYYTNSILYTRGAIKDKPSIDELLNYIQEGITKYEQEYMVKTNKEASSQFFFDLNNNANNDFYLPTSLDSKFKIAFNQTLQDSLALLVTISLILVIIFGREVKMILTYLSAIFGIGGIIEFVLSRLIINKDVSSAMVEILNKMSKSYIGFSVALIIIAILCMVAFFLIKKFYHPVVRRDIEQELENEVYNSYIEKQQRQYYNNMNGR